MPGVQSIGNLVGRAEATSIGLVYCSQDRGAWVWNGGNTSNKISQNIDDNFFDLESNRILSNNYGFYVYQWQKWVMFSNNIIYDTTTGGWWTLYPRAGVNIGSLVGREIFWYSLAVGGNQMAVGPLRLSSSGDYWYSLFDNRVPSSTYQWQSLPIHVIKDADRVIDIRQIIVRASDPTGSNTSTVRVGVGFFSATSTETINTTPTVIRFNVGNTITGTLTDILITLFANNTGGNSAPIIHSVDIGYTVRASVGVNN
jgi:hypothetical protein